MQEAEDLTFDLRFCAFLQRPVKYKLWKQRPEIRNEKAPDPAVRGFQYVLKRTISMFLFVLLRC